MVFPGGVLNKRISIGIGIPKPCISHSEMRENFSKSGEQSCGSFCACSSWRDQAWQWPTKRQQARNSSWPWRWVSALPLVFGGGNLVTRAQRLRFMWVSLKIMGHPKIQCMSYESYIFSVKGTIFPWVCSFFRHTRQCNFSINPQGATVQRTRQFSIDYLIDLQKG